MDSAIAEPVEKSDCFVTSSADERRFVPEAFGLDGLHAVLVCWKKGDGSDCWDGRGIQPRAGPVLVGAAVGGGEGSRVTWDWKKYPKVFGKIVENVCKTLIMAALS